MKNIISQNIYPFRSSHLIDSTWNFLLAWLPRSSRWQEEKCGWKEGNSEMMERNTRTHRGDGCTCNSRLDLDIENSPLMTATRNAGSLVLATWPGSSPLAPRVAPVSLFPSSVACSPVLSTAYNSSYLERLTVNYHTGSNVDSSSIR